MEQVYIVDCAEYNSETIAAGIRAAATALGVPWPQEQEVLLHPACPWAHPRFAPHAHTHPAVLSGAAAALTGNPLTIATNSLPGFPTRYSYRQAGYVKLSQQLGAQLVALDEAATQVVQLREDAGVDKKVALPKPALQADFTVALPKLTGSPFVSFAGAIRHHQSLLQDDAQAAGHQRLHTKMVDLLAAAPPDLIVVDAIAALHQGGELTGELVGLGMLIIGTNPVAVDTLCALAYGLDPTTIKYLQLASERGYGPADPAQIQVWGELTLAELTARAAQVEHIDPDPAHYPLPPQVKVLRSDKSGLSGTAGALTEVFLLTEQGGISWRKSREAVIVLGKMSGVPTGQDEKATIVFLGDSAHAEYQGYSRAVRLSGRYVPVSKLLTEVPYALKVSNVRNEIGEGMMVAALSSRVGRFLDRLTGKGRPAHFSASHMKGGKAKDKQADGVSLE